MNAYTKVIVRKQRTYNRRKLNTLFGNDPLSWIRSHLHIKGKRPKISHYSLVTMKKRVKHRCYLSVSPSNKTSYSVITPKMT